MTRTEHTERPPVLILDDESDLCVYVADVGDDLGFDAQWCDNFEDFACRYSVDLRGIFLDLAMPGMDGVEIIRFLGDNNSQARLVLMSGHDMHVLEAARRLAESRGMKVVGVLHKPFSLEALSEIYGRLAQVEQPVRPQATQAKIPGYTPTLRDLDNALGAGHVVPYFQPKYRVSDGVLVGAEVLARWIDPTVGMIGPDQFIPLAEKEGLIGSLTSLIIGKALAQGRRWADVGQSVKLALNLSPTMLHRLDLPETLTDQVAAHGLSPEQVTLEITESALASDYTASLDILTRLRMRRFSLSIDDFGTGYSSLKQLQHGPFTELKVDQSFIRRAHEEEGALAIVESSIHLGHRLGMKVVAEGIETTAQLELLRKLGCEECQGYLLGRPVPPESFPLAKGRTAA